MSRFTIGAEETQTPRPDDSPLPTGGRGRFGGSSSGGGTDPAAPAGARASPDTSSDPDPEPDPSDYVPTGVDEILDIDFGDQLGEFRDELENQFQSDLDQTREGFSDQIDDLTGTVSGIQTNVNQRFDTFGDRFSALGQGLGQTQDQIAGIPGSIAALFGDEESGDGGSGGGIGTGTLAAAGTAVAAAAYIMTQRGN